jgi:hypothetical protein
MKLPAELNPVFLKQKQAMEATVTVLHQGLRKFFPILAQEHQP